MRIEFTSGEEIRQIVPSAVSFTPYGVYIGGGGTARLVPWAQVRKISDAEQGEVWGLIQEAQPGR